MSNSAAKPSRSPLLLTPLILGGALTGIFYLAIYQGYIDEPLVVRYFAGHPVEMVTTSLFFVALMAQFLHLLAVYPERRALQALSLGEVPAGGQPVSECPQLLERLDQFSTYLKSSYLYQRLRWAVEYVRRKHSVDKLDDELKYLSDLDAEARHGRHAFVRVIIWAVPMLGFLGTVIGLTAAIGNLSPDVSNDSLHLVTNALGNAFDTTALALALSMVLMFTQFVVDRTEMNLLDLVDARTHEELASRFQTITQSEEPVFRAVQEMSERLLEGTSQLVEQQASLWRASLDEGQRQWSELAQAQQQQLESALSKVIGQQLQAHAQSIHQTEHELLEKQQQHWASFQTALVQMSEALNKQHSELSRQGEILLQIIQGTQQIVKLEDALNRNLSELSGHVDFQEAIHSLSAAAHLLTAKLNSDDHRQVKLPRPLAEGDAA